MLLQVGHKRTHNLRRSRHNRRLHKHDVYFDVSFVDFGAGGKVHDQVVGGHEVHYGAEV